MPVPFLHLAPLHGVTNRLYRSAWFRHFGGFDAAMAPFVAAIPSLSRKERHFKELLPRAETDPPLIPQIMGNDPECFLETAAILADAGYPEVNWNLGCPYPMVAKKKRGSGLLPFTGRIEAFLDEVCPRLAVPLSVKLRLGRNDPADIERLVPVLNAHPLSRVIIHPRIGTQMYRGAPDLDAFASAAAALTRPVVYNGDISSLSAFRALRDRFPAIREWMIGRSAVSDPFLPAAIKGSPPPADPLARIRAFHDDLYSGYRSLLSGPGHVLDKMKEVWTYLAASLGGADTQLRAISQAKGFAEYDAAVEGVFRAAARRA